MFQAQYLMTKESEGGRPVFSPWQQRGGDKIIYTIDIVEAVGATILVELFHKNSEDTGDGTSTGSSIGPTAVLDRTFKEFTGGLKELFRYKMTVFASTGGELGWVLSRMLPAVQFDSVGG